MVAALGVLEKQITATCIVPAILMISAAAIGPIVCIKADRVPPLP